MATAQTIINAALRKLGALGVGESPDATESADCLVALNQMLEGWRNERLMAYVIQGQDKAISAAQSSITVGTAGSWTIERPLVVESLLWVESQVAYEIDAALTQAQWDELSATPSSGTPEYAYYDAAYPTATLNWWPSNTNAGTLTMGVRVPLSAFSALSTAVSLPPGYERALTYNLAVELASEYQLPVPPGVGEAALSSKADIKRTNLKVPVLGIRQGLPMRSGPADIVRGY